MDFVPLYRIDVGVLSSRTKDLVGSPLAQMAIGIQAKTQRQ